MYNKYTIPVEVLEVLQPLMKKNSDNFIIDGSDDSLLKFKSTAQGSDFYFKIIKFKLGTELEAEIEMKPMNEKSTEPNRHWTRSGNIEFHLGTWASLLARYKAVKTPWDDDPIVDQYAREEFDEWRHVSEEEASEPMTTEQLIWLDHYLQFVEQNIEQFQNERNAKQIENIKEDIKLLRDDMSANTKGENAKKLSVIWGKLKKATFQGWKYFKKEAFKAGVKSLIEWGMKKTTELVRPAIEKAAEVINEIQEKGGDLIDSVKDIDNFGNMA